MVPFHHLTHGFPHFERPTMLCINPPRSHHLITWFLCSAQETETPNVLATVWRNPRFQTNLVNVWDPKPDSLSYSSWFYIMVRPSTSWVSEISISRPAPRALWGRASVENLLKAWSWCWEVELFFFWKSGFCFASGIPEDSWPNPAKICLRSITNSTRTSFSRGSSSGRLIFWNSKGLGWYHLIAVPILARHKQKLGWM